MIKRIIILLLAVILVTMLTGAVRIPFPSLKNAPEIKITVKKINYSKVEEPLTIFWADFKGLYKTVTGSDKMKTYVVLDGWYSNVLYNNYDTIYFLKYIKYPQGDIYKLDMPTKKLTRLTTTGGIDYFFLKNNSIYYSTNSMTLEPGLFRMSLEGKTSVKVNPLLFGEGDKRFRYYLGSGPITDSGLYFPLVREPWPTTDETYIETKDEVEYIWDSKRKKKAEVLSTFDVSYSDYIGDVESDTFVYVELDLISELDLSSGISYLHLFHNNKEVVRKIKGWRLEPIAILNGWVYFQTADEKTEGLFAIRPDGSGLRQIADDELEGFLFIGSIKQHLVFKAINEGSFKVIKAL